MTKLKTPLLSLGASGSLGDEITFRQSRRIAIAEKKPIPTYRRTLLQYYQRSLYQDYIALWCTLSTAEKQTWQSAASRYHMTGFAYFMGYYLKNMTDLAAWWTLDEPVGLNAYDRSRNGNTGTIIGASSFPGQIARARLFDGLNDYIDCGNDGSLQLTTNISVACWFKSTTGNVASKINAPPNERSWSFYRTAGNLLSCILSDDGSWGVGHRKQYITSIVMFDDIKHHFGFSFEGATSTLKLYIAGVEDTLVNKAVDDPITSLYNSIRPVLIGASHAGGVPAAFLAGWVDDFRIFNSILPADGFARLASMSY